MEQYLGERLKMLREERKWSQSDLAKRLNKAPSTISGYESDARSIPTDVLVSLAILFDISIDEFVGIEKPEQISIKGLNARQRNSIKALRAEYLVSTSNNGQLSNTQMEILRDIIQNFVNIEK